MRAVIQRVSNASVTGRVFQARSGGESNVDPTRYFHPITVDKEVISSISKGLMVLVGIGSDDTEADMQTIANKIVTLRVFEDNETSSPWKKSVKDIGGEILCVSQFTLMASTTKNKPDFHRAMKGENSRILYGSLLSRLGELYEPGKIKDGKFGAMMSVGLTNEGPVTLTIDSRKFEYVGTKQSLPEEDRDCTTHA